MVLVAALALFGPALAQITIRSELAADHEVRPGEVVEGTVLIENSGTSEATVKISQTDYLFQADGSNQFDEPGTVHRSNAAWLDVPTGSLTIPGGQRSEMRYRIEVPDEEFAGSYWSVIMIEEAVPAPALPTEGVAVTTVMRYAVQVTTTFGRSGVSLLQFTEPTLEGDEASGHAFELDIVNVGDRLLRAEYFLELYDAAGVQVAIVEGSSGRTYPGTSLRRSFPLGHLEPGEYTAIVVADAGGDDLFGAQYQLDVRE